MATLNQDTGQQVNSASGLAEVARRVYGEIVSDEPQGEVIVYKCGESWETAVLSYRDGEERDVRVVGDFSQSLLTVTPRGMRLLLDVLDADEKAVFIPRRVALQFSFDVNRSYLFAKFLKACYDRGLSRVLSSEVEIGDPLDPLPFASGGGFISMEKARRVYADISADTPPLTENPVTGAIWENNAPPGFGNTNQQVNPAPVEDTNQRVTPMPGELCPKCVHAAECPADERGAVIECADFTRRPADDGFGFFADDKDKLCLAV